ncbi:MAG: class I SAM-dependent methyltransferase [Promethearchaeota archaeon]
MPVDYKAILSKLMQALPYVISFAAIEGKADVVYSTDNWDIKADIDIVISNWLSLKMQPIIISGIKYLIRLCTNERLVATSIKGEGHIIGAKDDKRKIIVRIEPDGIIGFAYMELAKVLVSLSDEGFYLDKSEQLVLKNQKMGDISSTIKDIKKIEQKNIENGEVKIDEEQYMDNKSASIPFTSRLMAYYRAQEYKRDNPLIIDPFAERLAGDLSSYLKEHIRYSEMDYPIVRSYYIEKNLLEPWCNAHAKSQIVLLGAGLDTRAYRFAPLKTNTHTIFEIDFPIVIRYKEEILGNVQPLCHLVRISTDISDSEWTSIIFKSGFSKNTPTFWVLEGLAYYMERATFETLLTKIAEISTENCKIFVDIMHQSRWIPNRILRNDLLKDSFSRHFKWGLDIKNVPFFFAKTGWNVMCSFADDYDQGRNVGQRGMIFIHGVRAIIT